MPSPGLGAPAAVAARSGSNVGKDALASPHFPACYSLTLANMFCGRIILGTQVFPVVMFSVTQTQGGESGSDSSFAVGPTGTTPEPSAPRAGPTGTPEP